MNQRRAIAIVDDDALVRSGMVSLVRAFGFPVRTFDSAEAALGDDLHDIACVISDVQMPGLSGLDLLARLRLGHPDVPVILVTAFPEPGIESRARSEGAASFHDKACPPEELLAAIRAAIAS